MSMEHKVFTKAVDMCLKLIRDNDIRPGEALMLDEIAGRHKVYFTLSPYTIPLPFSDSYAAGRCIVKGTALEVFIHPFTFCLDTDTEFQCGHDFLDVLLHEIIHLVQVMTGKLNITEQQDTRFVKAIIDHAEEECKQRTDSLTPKLHLLVDSSDIEEIGRMIKDYLEHPTAIA